MKKILATTLVMIAAVSLTGCGEVVTEVKLYGREENTATVLIQDLPDGRTVTCLTWDTMNGASPISCDWANAK